jgi:phage terminase small subunit
VSGHAAVPRAPAGLRAPGRAVWRRVHEALPAGWAFDAGERVVLEQIARLTDTLADLDAAVKRDGVTVKGSRGQTVIHPGVAEARQHRVAIRQLLRALDLDVSDDGGVSRPASERASRAARARWHVHRRGPSSRAS